MKIKTAIAHARVMISAANDPRDTLHGVINIRTLEAVEKLVAVAERTTKVVVERNLDGS